MSTLELKKKIEKIIENIGHPVAIKGTWDDENIYTVVRGKDSFLMLRRNSGDKGLIKLVRLPLKLQRQNKKFFLIVPVRTRSNDFSKTIIKPGWSSQTEDQRKVGYANIYKWLLQNKESLA